MVADANTRITELSVDEVRIRSLMRDAVARFSGGLQTLGVRAGTASCSPCR
jgi:hypothetical protein